MGDMVCCPLDGGDRWAPRRVEVVRARKEYQCTECLKSIAKGERHEAYTAKWDDYVSTERTCLLCVEIRDHFACDTGWTFGEVWSQLRENFFPDMRAGGPCMDGLSPEAKARLFEAKLQWDERHLK